MAGMILILVVSALVIVLIGYARTRRCRVVSPQPDGLEKKLEVLDTLICGLIQIALFFVHGIRIEM